ncbi:hypothetical protein Syun_028312 [Stephania yunnanensis]|uniref:Uncharacterized protein n=1 Tax=Stephania yunnanensis TaxID=152371 RepID=A0AAP0EH47_9MAGN
MYDGNMYATLKVDVTLDWDIVNVKKQFFILKGGMKVKADRDESSPYLCHASFFKMLQRACKELGITLFTLSSVLPVETKRRHLVLVHDLH